MNPEYKLNTQFLVIRFSVENHNEENASPISTLHSYSGLISSPVSSMIISKV